MLSKQKLKLKTKSSVRKESSNKLKAKKVKRKQNSTLIMTAMATQMRKTRTPTWKAHALP